MRNREILSLDKDSTGNLDSNNSQTKSGKALHRIIKINR